MVDKRKANALPTPANALLPPVLSRLVLLGSLAIFIFHLALKGVYVERALAQSTTRSQVVYEV